MAGGPVRMRCACRGTCPQHLTPQTRESRIPAGLQAGEWPGSRGRDRSGDVTAPPLAGSLLPARGALAESSPGGTGVRISHRRPARECQVSVRRSSNRRGAERRVWGGQRPPHSGAVTPDRWPAVLSVWYPATVELSLSLGAVGQRQGLGWAEVVSPQSAPSPGSGPHPPSLRRCSCASGL